VPARSLGAPGSAGDKPASTRDTPGSACDNSGCTSNHSRAVWEKHHRWERFWCTWKSWLLFIVQRFLKLMNSIYNLIYVSSANTISVRHNGSVRVDELWQGSQRHLGGGKLRARPEYHAARCISPSDGCVSLSSSLCWSPILNKCSGIVANCNHTSEWVHWVRACISIAMRLVTLGKSLLAFLLPARKMQFSHYYLYEFARRWVRLQKSLLAFLLHARKMPFSLY
jgi:hypothetical protein